MKLRAEDIMSKFIRQTRENFCGYRVMGKLLGKPLFGHLL